MEREIDISPAMLAAGVEAYRLCEPWDSGSSVAEAIYKAMASARADEEDAWLASRRAMNQVKIG